MATNKAMALPITRVVPSKGWNGIDFRELWECRDLLQVLIWREVNVRYKQTFAGIAWVLGQPVLTMIVMNFVFGRLVGQAARGAPYPLFVYVALVPWAFFSHALTRAASSLIELHATISKAYFPRLLVPLSVVLAGLVDFAVAFSLLPVLMFVYGVHPIPAIWMLPLIVIAAVCVALGIGLWLAALNVAFRDVAFALPFLMQIALFMTPVFYSPDIVAEQWRAVYALNPMVGVVEALRWALLTPESPIPWTTIIVSSLSTILILCGGLIFFMRREPEFADLV